MVTYVGSHWTMYFLLRYLSPKKIKPFTEIRFWELIGFYCSFQFKKINTCRSGFLCVETSLNYIVLLVTLTELRSLHHFWCLAWRLNDREEQRPWDMGWTSQTVIHFSLIKMSHILFLGELESTLVWGRHELLVATFSWCKCIPRLCIFFEK